MASTGLDKVRRLQFEVLLDKDRIARKVEELGRSISRDYQKKTPVLLGVLKGCFVFMADLIRHIDLPLEVDFISAASYRLGTKQEEELILESETSIPLKDRDVILVEGIVDTGKTITTILKELKKLEPASIEVVTLIDKPSSHRTTFKIKYRGFAIGNEFVIGYGLDNTQKYRNLPYIGKVVE